MTDLRPFVVRFDRAGGSSTYWYGPGHLFGTTSGYRMDDPEVARFTSRNATENALRRVYGSLAEFRRRGGNIVRISNRG